MEQIEIKRHIVRQILNRLATGAARERGLVDCLEQGIRLLRSADLLDAQAVEAWIVQAREVIAASRDAYQPKERADVR